MIEVFFQTLPFFALIGLGCGAGAAGFFSNEATLYLTRFVFYFALSAMLFRFSAKMSFAEILDWSVVSSYLAATFAVYLLVTAVAIARRCGTAEAAVEAQCAAIGNTGFLGIPMIGLLMGPGSVPVLMLVLACDLIVFSSLIVVLITGSRDGRVSPATVVTVGKGLLKNPMIVSMLVGFGWSALSWPLPEPADRFLDILGAAATPCALFAIGASLADKSAERVEVAVWLSFAKLILHPVAVAISVWFVFDVNDFAASVMIAAAALPVAGNVYILARQYGVAPARVSSAILISTVFSVVTVSLVVMLVRQ